MGEEEEGPPKRERRRELFFTQKLKSEDERDAFCERRRRMERWK
jgi:hypothetical protein